MKHDAIPSLRSRLVSPGAHPRSGAALLITLLTLALMTIIVVAFLSTMNWEVQASRRNYEAQKARAISTLGMNTAVAQLRTAFGKWDAPYGNVAETFSYPGFLTNAPTNYWSVSPGILTSWSFTSTTPNTNFPLFSLPANTATATTVNLNAPGEDGIYPILGSSTALPVYWVNVLTYPKSTVANTTNQIIGRYAFWIDDENSKININTADGTYKGTLQSLGAGTPTEVSLQELQGSTGTPLSATGASNIVTIARTVGFNSPKEILRATDPNGTITPDLYTNNIFNLTTASRSPDFNIFGQPKMPLVAASSTNAPYSSTGVAFLYNLSTLQPLRELFPSQTGNTGLNGVLPLATMTNRFSTISPTTDASVSQGASNARWPLAFQETSDLGLSPNPGSGASSIFDGSLWYNGMVIANYLSGTNVLNKPITWPALPGSTATSYLGKYTAHQIDSITMQIVDLAGKDTSPDFGRADGAVVRTSPMAFRGWLSGLLTSGIGRTPKLDKVLMSFNAYAGSAASSSSPPLLNTRIYLDLWFPSRFQGVSFFHKDVVYGAFKVGTADQQGWVNAQDMPSTMWYSINSGAASVNYATNVPAPLPKLPAGIIPGYANTTNTGIPDNGNPLWYSYWGNNLLRTDQGVDWTGNPGSIADPDQYLAQTYHTYLGTNNSSHQYYGGGPLPTTNSIVLQVTQPVKNSDTGSGTNEWAPGEYRIVSNANFWSTLLPMSTNAAGHTLNISGGIQYLSEQGGDGHITEPDPVPLDGMRGSIIANPPANFYGGYNRQSEPLSGTLTPYTNIINAVIPITTSISIPANGAFSQPPTAWVYGYVKDPLVNKFPGDWIVETSSGSPPADLNGMGMGAQYLNANTPRGDPADFRDDAVYANYPESSATRTAFTSTDPRGTTYSDPDAYWMPTIDNNASLGVYGIGAVALDPPQIPRTARFPSSGYLQYVRTGIIPDDETLPYVPQPGQNLSQFQHGTPFRLLNFSPSTDASQTLHGASYPDWAMLDLFYVPSSLLSYGSPYEAYAGPVVTQSTLGSTFPADVTYTNSSAVNNMYLYGTYGGATSGRINPNGAVVYTTNMNIPTPGISRTVPLQALFRGLMVNQTQTGNFTNLFTANDFHGPLLNNPTPVNETNLAAAITNYLTGNGSSGHTGPLRMPGEICNIPEIAALGPGATVNPTRNDLVRQVIGNLTTQSNTFSIWVEGQSILKSKGNTNYGIYESGDQITGTVRYHYIIERDLNPGLDGVYGNAATGSVSGTPYAGQDGVVGTLDDLLLTTTNPSMPNYIYRIIYAEEIR